MEGEEIGQARRFSLKRGGGGDGGRKSGKLDCFRGKGGGGGGGGEGKGI